MSNRASGAGRADEAILAKLHELLAEDFARRLKDGEQVMVGKGEDRQVVNVAPSAATLNVIRQFLKDNGIEALVDRNKPMKEIVEHLPFDEDDETIVSFTQR